MAGIKVKPEDVAAVGAEFSNQSDKLTGAVSAFLAGAQIDGDGIGWLGPGKDAMKAYKDLLNHVTEHLHSLETTVEKVGTNLTDTAIAYQKMEDANTLPGG